MEIAATAAVDLTEAGKSESEAVSRARASQRSPPTLRRRRRGAAPARRADSRGL